MLPTNGLYGHMQKNVLKSALLLIGFVVLIALFWTSWCIIYSAFVDHWWAAKPASKYLRPKPITMSAVFATGYGRALTWWWMPLFLSSCWFVVAYFCYADIIRASTGAREVNRREQPRLYNMVERLSIAAGLPMPKVQIMRTGALNAYAAGLTLDDSAVAVTRGLLNKLTDAELEAVIAHELTHIKNRDVRLMVIATVFAGGLTLVGAGVANLVSGGGSAVGGAVATGAAEGAAKGVLSGDGENLPGLIASILVAIMFLCLAHLFAILIYFAISRSREFLADAGAVEITKDADAMISALNKISNDDDEVPGLNANLRAMMISSSAESLFSTHPSIDQRVSALRTHAGGRQSVARRVSRPVAGASPWGGAVSGASMSTPSGAVGFGRRPARMKPLAR